MRRLLPPARGRGHFQSPEMHTFATESRVRDWIVVLAGLEREYVGAATRADMVQATAFAKEAASRGGVGVLGAELGHAER